MAQALAWPGKLTFPWTKNRWGSQGLKGGGGQLGTLLPPPPTALGPGRMVTATSSEGRVLSELPGRQLQTVGTLFLTGGSAASRVPGWTYWQRATTFVPVPTSPSSRTQRLMGIVLGEQDTHWPRQSPAASPHS